MIGKGYGYINCWITLKEWKSGKIAAELWEKGFTFTAFVDEGMVEITISIKADMSNFTFKAA